MATSLHHLVKKSDAPDQFMPFDTNCVANPPITTNNITAESLVYFSTITGTQPQGQILPLSNDTNASTFAGVCMDAVPAQYGAVDLPGGVSPNGPRNLARVSKACQMNLKATSADAIKPNVKIYAGADAQTMTVQAGSNAIGYIDPEQPYIASATAGQLILCRVRANYPATPVN